MRRKLIAANWKMHKTIAEAVAFARELRSRPAPPAADLLVIPPYLSLPAVAGELADSGIAVGAQDISWERSGAFTGEVSGPMIADAGGGFVLVGHSERRHVIGEDNETVARKLTAALDANLIPILCVGEKIESREKGTHETVVGEQLDTALSGRDAGAVSRIVVAYEPVWAIGTGKTATPEDAVAMHAFIRERVRGAYGSPVAEELRIQYGGSVKPDNAAELLQSSEIDGALVGGASLEVDSFLAIADAAGR